MSDNNESNNDEPKRYEAIDYILTSLIFLAAFIGGPTSSQNAFNQNTNDPNFEIAHWTRVVGRWTRGLVVIGVITAVVLAAQAYMLWVTDQTSRNINRAFVIPNDLSLVPATANGHDIKYWLVSTSIENAGNTSTRDLEVYTGIFEDDLSLVKKIPNLIPNNPDINELNFRSDKLPNRWILGPKEKIKIPPYVIDEALASQMRDDTLAIYILGTIYYFDTLDSGERHKTKFCYKLLGRTGNPDNTGAWGTRRVDLPEIPIMSSRPCFHNNCTDKECGPEKSPPQSMQ